MKIFTIEKWTFAEREDRYDSDVNVTAALGHFQDRDIALGMCEEAAKAFATQVNVDVTVLSGPRWEVAGYRKDGGRWFSVFSVIESEVQ